CSRFIRRASRRWKSSVRAASVVRSSTTCADARARARPPCATKCRQRQPPRSNSGLTNNLNSGGHKPPLFFCPNVDGASQSPRDGEAAGFCQGGNHFAAKRLKKHKKGQEARHSKFCAFCAFLWLSFSFFRLKYGVRKPTLTAGDEMQFQTRACASEKR